MAALMSQALIDKNHVDRIVFVAPRTEVISQTSRQFTEILGQSMTKVTGADCDIEDYGIDLCCTWNSIINLKEAFQRSAKNIGFF